MKIENCWKLKLLTFLFRKLRSVLKCIVLTNIVSNVRVSLSEKSKYSNLIERIDLRGFKAEGEIKRVGFYCTSFKLVINL